MAGGEKVSPAIWSATGTPLDCEMLYRYLYSTVHGQPCVITQQVSLLYRRIRISRLPVLTSDYIRLIAGVGSSRTGLDLEDKILWPWPWPRRFAALALASRRSGHKTLNFEL